jgi:hypothetical protein
MPDHLPLPGPIVLKSRRRTTGHSPDQDPLEPDRHGHATTLAGVLAGLGLPYPGFDSQVPEEEPVDSRIVLVFEGRAALERGPFRKWQMTPLAETDGNSYLVLSDAESRRTFADLVAQYGGDPGEWDRPESWRNQLDAITGVRLYGREDRTSPELAELSFAGAEVVDVLVWPSTLEDPRRRRKAAAARVAEVEDLVTAAAVRNAAVRVAAADPRPDTTMLRIVADEELLDLLLDHPLVERIHPPVRPRVSHADLAAVTGPSGPVVPSGEPIGVIDDLVHDNPYLVGAITARDSFPSGRTFSTPTGHGTQVAGIAAYGDLGSAVGPGAGLAAPLPIYGARIMEQDPGDPSRAIVVGPMHRQLEDALRWLHSQGVKIAVCSINADDPDDGALPTAATAMLDELARELDMVVVVSAGNRPDPVQAHWLRDYPAYLLEPAARVAEPGAAALALTVGAIAKYDVLGSRGRTNQVAIAKSGQPSPFTRIGPVRGRTASGTRKPEFAAHGGNYAWDSLLGSKVGHDPSMSVVTLAPPGLPGGRLVCVVDGTSFAAPFVAHQVGRIATRYPNAGANLLRALTALSARPLAPMPSSGLDVTQVAAYGVPDAASVLESGAHRVILVYQGSIAPDSNVIHEVPVPDEFATGRIDQQVTVALAFDPPVRRSRRAYVAGSMAVDFIRNRDLDEVVETYERQPTLVERAQDPALTWMPLPSGHDRPALEPGSQALLSNTLIRRRVASTLWSPDDEGYYLVVSHSSAPWAKTSDGPGESQDYALAIELAVRNTVAIDLHALVRTRLAVRPRIRGRSSR